MNKGKVFAGALAAAGTMAGCAVYGSYRAWHPAAPRPQRGKKHIVCVGDSITFGAGVLPLQRVLSYPAYLQRILGGDCQVMNFGLSGRTLLSSGDMPYTAEKHYLKSLDIENADYIIMLGTNDTKPQNWDEVRFGAELRELLCAYQKRGRVTVMTPPKAFVVPGKMEIAYEIRDEMLQEEREIIACIAKTLHIAIIDLYHFTRHHPEWFPDGVHPNAEGNREIANHIAAMEGQYVLYRN